MDKIQENQTKLKENKDEIKTKQDQIEEQKKEIDILQGRLLTCDEFIQKYTQEISDQKDVIHQLESKNKNLSSEAKNNTRILKQLRNENSDFRNEIMTFKTLSNEKEVISC